MGIFRRCFCQNDAFGTCHRTHASNVGIATYIKRKMLWFLVRKKKYLFSKNCQTPQRPLVAVLEWLQSI
ncbi:phosphoglycerate kinase [Areca yellow leaf disease phytoplasma]|uniref:phosphoglycerate kinase n=1 Tax=Areca yellow leaf disease phytoplasma TaxID=927614 RepID=UPI0035B56E64